MSIVPLRAEPKDTSEQTSQLLYGEFFTVFDKRKSWSKIQNESDGYEGWVNNKHFLLIEKANFEKLQNTPKVYS
ncbi:MAG: SH3 domain-containing protein, partial [Bacteroidota bacterium]|nr:SH3 domain-containing protein [Bacteroidota bacterium]